MTLKTDDKQAIDEAAASFGVDASVPEPIAKDGHANRGADKNQGDAPKSLGKAEMLRNLIGGAYSLSHPELTDKYRQFFGLTGGADTEAHNLSTIGSSAKQKDGPKKLAKEDLDLAFDGSDLSEDFKEKAATIFEAAVQTHVELAKAELDEEYETKLQESLEAQRVTIAEQVDTYLNFVVEQWMEDNKLAVTTGIKSDILESFLGGMKELFVEHYVDVPDDKVDVVESLAGKVEELENKLVESENKVIEAQKSLHEMEAKAVFAEVTEGLTDTQVDKLKSLSESVDTSDVEQYRKTLSTLAEGYVTKKLPVSATEQLNEEVDLDAGTKKNASNDPLVASVANAIKTQKSR